MSRDRTRRKPAPALTSEPEMGCITLPAISNAFSVRLPPDLRTKAEADAASKKLLLGEYVRDAVQAAVTGKPVRRRRAKFDDLRQDFAELHAAIIIAGNQIAGKAGGVANRETIDLLRQIVTRLLELESAVRGK